MVNMSQNYYFLVNCISKNKNLMNLFFSKNLLHKNNIVKHMLCEFQMIVRQYLKQCLCVQRRLIYGFFEFLSF